MEFFASYLSPLGKLWLFSDGRHLTKILPGEAIPTDAQPGDCPVLRQTQNWLDGYFQGENPEQNIPLAPAGTAFQRQVWMLLMDIPYGEVRTYGDIARQLHPNMSPQAVGQAVGRNPIAIVIPCHRVVGARGRLTGYAWGLENKKWLLNHEGWNIQEKECE